ncbi:hypothetical protein D9M68_901740 [compost metagenome]
MGWAGRAAEYERQEQGRLVPVVEEWLRQYGQIVADLEAQDVELQLALGTEIQPQAGMHGILGRGVVAAHQLEAQVIEVANEAGIQRERALDLLAEFLLKDRQHAHQFVVEVHLDVRAFGVQRRGGGVEQLQFGGLDQLVAAHAELGIEVAQHVAQQ